MRVHLRGYMQSRLGERARDLGCDADVLHDERIGAGAVRLAHRLERTRHLGGQHGGVERHVHAHAAQMRVRAGVCQRIEREVVGAATRVEGFEAEVHGVRPSAHGGTERRGVAGRREQFDGMLHGDSLPIYSSTSRTLRNRMRCGVESSGVLRPNVTIRYQRYGSIVER